MEQRSSVRMMTVATALTIGGMCLAALDAFCLPGVWGPVGLAIVYVFGGGPASIRALTALWRERSLDIDLLMVIAAVAAAAVDAALEGAVLLTLFSISTTLEHRVMGRARRAVEALMSLRPDTALLRQPDGSVTEVPVRQLQPGDHMVLRPGAKVPVNRASVDRQRQLLRDIDDELQTLRGEIRSETPAEIDLDDDASVASWLTRIGRWAETRALALTAWDDLRLALRDAEDAKAALGKGQHTLLTTLISVGIDIDGLDIAALMQTADTVLADHAAMQTSDEYTGLATRADKDREALIGLSRQGGSKLAVEMSKGTQFQLYLALRLAGYEEFATARPSVPFIADDIMETFDEPRSEEVFRLFGQMAQVGQVVYLTHHRHLCEIAAEVVPQVKVHEIAFG